MPSDVRILHIPKSQFASQVCGSLRSPIIQFAACSLTTILQSTIGQFNVYRLESFYTSTTIRDAGIWQRHCIVTKVAARV